ncbi:hypothetical protein ACFL0T_00720 [Candidatus Omnitrophota bacterium]
MRFRYAILIVFIGTIVNGSMGVINHIVFPPSPVEIEVKNVSNKDIESFQLIGVDKTTRDFNGVDRGETKDVQIQVAGEWSYKLKVLFSDGTVIEGGAGYVESKYRVREIVSDAGIKSEVSLPQIHEYLSPFVSVLFRNMVPMIIVALLVVCMKRFDKALAQREREVV